MSKDTKLVYSTDPEINRRCPHCKNLLVECECKPEVDPTTVKYTAVLRIEKKGRGGKTVSVVAKLPPSPQFLKDLAQKLKNRCGSGGTSKVEGDEGFVEIQGDKLAIIRTALTDLGIKFKG